VAQLKRALDAQGYRGSYSPMMQSLSPWRGSASATGARSQKATRPATGETRQLQMAVSAPAQSARAARARRTRGCSSGKTVEADSDACSGSSWLESDPTRTCGTPTDRASQIVDALADQRFGSPPLGGSAVPLASCSSSAESFLDLNHHPVGSTRTTVMQPAAACTRSCWKFVSPLPGTARRTRRDAPARARSGRELFARQCERDTATLTRSFRSL
jgi:hypothetical protein